MIRYDMIILEIDDASIDLMMQKRGMIYDLLIFGRQLKIANKLFGSWRTAGSSCSRPWPGLPSLAAFEADSLVAMIMIRDVVVDVGLVVVDDGWMDGGREGRTDGRTDEANGRMDTRMDVVATTSADDGGID